MIHSVCEARNPTQELTNDLPCESEPNPLCGAALAQSSVDVDRVEEDLARPCPALPVIALVALGTVQLCQAA